MDRTYSIDLRLRNLRGPIGSALQGFRSSMIGAQNGDAKHPVPRSRRKTAPKGDLLKCNSIHCKDFRDWSAIQTSRVTFPMLALVAPQKPYGLRKKAAFATMIAI